MGHFGVSCQYIQYRANPAVSSSSLSSRLAAALSDRRFDAVTEYEYYDDEIDDFSTTTTKSTPTTTTTTTSTTTTTTPKPITSYRLLHTTPRNGFRPLINFNSINNGNTKKKSDTTNARQQYQQYQLDSYTEASNDNAFVQKFNNQLKQPVSAPQLRNAIADVNRRVAHKDYLPEKSNPIDPKSDNGGSFSRRYARFLFKLRSG